MIRFILNLIRVIISIYLCAMIILTAYIMTYKKLYNDPYPLVFGYSYFKMDNDFLSPDYQKNDYMFLKHTEEDVYSVGDYVVYLENGQNVRAKKVTEVNEYMLTLNYTNHNDENTIDVNEILAKEVYSNSTLSKVLHIITNPVVIVVMFIAVLILPELTYRRYN
jgi:hypothetical protein